MPWQLHWKGELCFSSGTAGEQPSKGCKWGFWQKLKIVLLHHTSQYCVVKDVLVDQCHALTLQCRRVERDAGGGNQGTLARWLYLATSLIIAVMWQHSCTFPQYHNWSKGLHFFLLLLGGFFYRNDLFPQQLSLSCTCKSFHSCWSNCSVLDLRVAMISGVTCCKV